MKEMMMMMMPMTFSMSTHTTILFDGWVTDTGTKYAFALIGTIIGGFLYHLCTYLSRLVKIRRNDSVSLLTYADQNSKLQANKDYIRHRPKLTMFQRILLTLIYLCQVTIAYFLMLIAMTFNGGLFICVIAGLTVGYSLFMDLGQSSSEVTTCH